jgi:predicted DsbA family dithiol-disulfide isomerase
LAPEVPIALPPGKPNTLPAIVQAVELLRTDRVQGMAFVRAVYRAFWRDGQDISDPSVLSRLSGVTLPGDQDENSHRISQEWEAAWHETGQAGVPLIVSPQGDLLVGCVPVEQVRRFFA